MSCIYVYCVRLLLTKWRLSPSPQLSRYWQMFPIEITWTPPSCNHQKVFNFISKWVKMENFWLIFLSQYGGITILMKTHQWLKLDFKTVLFTMLPVYHPRTVGFHQTVITCLTVSPQSNTYVLPSAPQSVLSWNDRDSQMRFTHAEHVNGLINPLHINGSIHIRNISMNVKMLDITRLIPLVCRSLVNILPDINGFPLLGVQCVSVLHGWISFESLCHFKTGRFGERTGGHMCCFVVILSNMW